MIIFFSPFISTFIVSYSYYLYLFIFFDLRVRGFSNIE